MKKNNIFFKVVTIISFVLFIGCIQAQISVIPGEMITIPAGDFIMGSNGKFNEERPQHSVYLPTYQIGKFEVTRGEYRKFMEAGGYSNKSLWSDAGWKWKEYEFTTQPDCWVAEQDWNRRDSFFQTDMFPVVGITWYEAEAYCKWAGGRLPTEEEWEKAASWTGTHQNIFPWGDVWDKEKFNGWHDTNPAGGGDVKYQTAPVGSYPSGASHYGCMDMFGNALEWCAGSFRSYPGCPKAFDESDKSHVLRGGGTLPYDIFRCSARNPMASDRSWFNSGFRMAR